MIAGRSQNPSPLAGEGAELSERSFVAPSPLVGEGWGGGSLSELKKAPPSRPHRSRSASPTRGEATRENERHALNVRFAS